MGRDEIRMLRLFTRVADSGPPKDDEISHILDRERGIWEFIRGGVRVPYFYDEGKVVVCSHGFAKSSRKTPKQELSRAQRCFDQYEAAKARNDLEVEEET